MKEMLVRVRYNFEGKEHRRTYLKRGSDDVKLQAAFDQVIEMYEDLKKTYQISQLVIISEMITATEAAKFVYRDKEC